MLTLYQGKKAIDFSRSILLATVTKQAYSKGNLPDVFNEHHGVFTTLHTYPSKLLRGCIGIPEPIMALKNALIESAQSVTHDPRFPVLEAEELDHIIVEITILTKPEIITSKNNEVVNTIHVGRDGLIIEQGFFKGLLLPQVPIEQKWNAQTFIEHTCLKAGLPKDAWMNENTIIKKFTGQIFSEEKPYGAIKEKTFDES
jgi:uncharacterized protein (TIGR00296 family)